MKEFLIKAAVLVPSALLAVWLYGWYGKQRYEEGMYVENELFESIGSLLDSLSKCKKDDGEKLFYTKRALKKALSFFLFSHSGCFYSGMGFGLG